MTNEKKIEVLEEALNYYQDRTSLTNKDEKELQTFFNELKKTILVTRCCETVPDLDFINLLDGELCDYEIINSFTSQKKDAQDILHEVVNKKYNITL